MDMVLRMRTCKYAWTGHASAFRLRDRVVIGAAVVPVPIPLSANAAATPPREFEHKTQCHLHTRHTLLWRDGPSVPETTCMPRGGESPTDVLAFNFTHRGNMSEPAPPPPLQHVIPGSTPSPGGVEVGIYTNSCIYFTTVLL